MGRAAVVAAILLCAALPLRAQDPPAKGPDPAGTITYRCPMDGFQRSDPGACETCGMPLSEAHKVRQNAKPPAPKADDPHWTVNGYVTTDLAMLHSEKHERDAMPEEGFNGEFAIGATYYARKDLSFTVRACYGCHQLEVQNAYADVAVTDRMTLRFGRIPLPFGSMSRRTHPAHLEASTMPLPYIMGGMVRRREFNQGVLPAPAIDNGVAISSSTWLGAVQVGFEGAAVRGFKGNSPDLNFSDSRDFEDNNGEPAGVARLTATWGDLAIGASSMYGRYDDEHELAYALAEADVHLRLGPANLRLEAVLRDTEFRDPAEQREESRRLGYAIQFDVPVADRWRAFVLHDALELEDLFLTPTGPINAPVAGATDDENEIRRGVGGVVFTPSPGVHVKGSAEYWDFSDFEDAWSFHLTFVGEF